MADAVPRAHQLRDCPGFARFWTASTVSGFGTYVTSLAIQVLVVITLHEGATEVGLVNAARWLPYLLFGLIVGVYVDRVRRRPLLVWADLVRAALLVAIPVLALTGGLSIPVLMGFMALFGCASLVGDAAGQSLLPRMVLGQLLAPANARLDQSDAVAQTSGPALAGALVSALTAPWAVLVDAASYLASALLLMRVSVAEPPSRAMSLRGVRGELVEGVRWVYGHRTMRPFAYGVHAWFLCFAVVNVVVPPFALRSLRLDAFGYGVALAVAGVGGLVGALAATRLGTTFGAGRVVIVCYAIMAVAVALLALSPVGWAGWLVFGAGELLVGLTMGASNANEMGFRQQVTPDRLQGRCNTTMRSINRAMIVVGAPLGGLLADTVGYRTVLGAAAGGFLVIAVAWSATPFRGVRLEV